MRLDAYLASAGLARSRTLAQKLIMSGCVVVNGKLEIKPSVQVSDADSIDIAESKLTRYVGRGGLKLEAALAEFAVNVKGLTALDIGSSTGGFTDCLLQAGAERVYCVDSGSGQLDEKLRADSRVIPLENINARYLDENSVPEKCGIIVMDVSFISQRLLYPTVCRFLDDKGGFISLIKPQFEVGRAGLGKNGIVTDESLRKAVIGELGREALAHGLKMQKTLPSPIRGGDGNIEYLAYFEAND